MAENCRDFVDYLGPDTSISVLTLLGDPSDLVRASSVSRSWRRLIIANVLFKNLCLRLCPEVSHFSGVMEISSSRVAVDVGSSTGMEWQILEREHEAYSYFSHYFVSPKGQRNCIRECISASSTDNYPDESIENTLEPSDRVLLRPSYWSSGGRSDPQVPETLTYRLHSNLCIVGEIKIRPFEAYFHYGNPIYSARAVRFRVGHSKLTQGTITETTDGKNIGLISADDNYIWTYVSPKFSMAQENTLQSFKLPCPVLCIGGVFQIELLGRVQKQEMDDLYYICVCHVQVMGRSLSPVFDLDIPASSGNLVLKYFPNARPRIVADAGSSSEREVMEITTGAAPRGWSHALNALLGTAFAFASDDSGTDDDEDVPQVAMMRP